jgi:hypothetical protein
MIGRRSGRLGQARRRANNWRIGEGNNWRFDAAPADKAARRNKFDHLATA